VAREEHIDVCVVPGAPQRLDQWLAAALPGYSRSTLQEWIKSGRVHLDHAAPRARDKVAGRELVSLDIPVVVAGAWAAQAIPLDIVYEDEDILVLNKAAGLVVHPGAGNPDTTLLNALLDHAPELRALPRAGIVHRLDKDTSGLMVVAKNELARLNLTGQLADRSLSREYLAVVDGTLVAGGTVDQPIARHPRDRLRMAVVARGKPAVTHYRVVERYRAHTLIRVMLETGRTHQIRVHMTWLRHPLVGDPVYGGRLRLPPGAAPELIDVLRGFRRQALHATLLGLVHPRTGEAMEWEVPAPEDFRTLTESLRRDAASQSKSPR
jgi:23S rRNA pseudouridine1911/1915/1917 synthase